MFASELEAMALPVRPPSWPAAPAQVRPANVQPGRNDARVAAQKAFFDAALAGKTAAAASAEPEAQSPRAARAAEAVRSVAATEARATDRLPPPGSIVNILV
jgi:hypothetical protein